MVAIGAPIGLLVFGLFGVACTFAKSSPAASNDIRYGLMGDTTICRTIPGMTKSQVEICYEQPDTTTVAFQGLKTAVEECQHQFQGHRWNCSTLATRAGNPYTNVMFKKGYRESAFAYAISSAGVAISVAKACSQGLLMNCGCNPKKVSGKTGMSAAKTFKWGGCSDNVKYGVRFAKIFLDSREQAGDIHSTMSLHNNEVGRMAVANNMQIKCKCHGMSGSCELKTCWRTSPDFKLVGKILKEKYKSAVLVDQTNLGNEMPKQMNIRRNRPQTERRKRRPPRVRRKQWTSRRPKGKRDLSNHLLFYQRSPNYCEVDERLDVPGTAGRRCNVTSVGPDSCSSLCCGRGYNHVRSRRVERCNCKFRWCCTVECQTCNVEEWLTVCK